VPPWQLALDRARNQIRSQTSFQFPPILTKREVVSAGALVIRCYQ
jgi:hypothetical protein